jgi:hypothetical protein
MAVIDGDPRRRRMRRGELAHPTLMASGSSSNSVLDEEAMMASLFPCLDGDKSGSTVVGHGEQSRREVERSRAVQDDAREKEMGDESLCFQRANA